jgi:hypothetical protein
MFGMLEKLTKATVAVALTPIAVVVDVVSLPATSMDLKRGAFDNTEKLLKSAAQNVEDALK